MRRVVLASGSPARLRTLRDVGIVPTVVVSGVDEDAFTHDDPAALVEALAVAKAQAVVRELPSASADAVVIGCDSVLDVDGTALGKPGTAERAADRWRIVRGRSAVLQTGHCLIDAATGRRVAGVAATTVHFADVGDDEIDRVRRDRRTDWRSPARSPSTATAVRSSSRSRATTTTSSACRCRSCGTCCRGSGCTGWTSGRSARGERRAVTRPAGPGPARSACAAPPRCPHRSPAPWHPGRTGRPGTPP